MASKKTQKAKNFIEIWWLISKKFFIKTARPNTWFESPVSDLCDYEDGITVWRACGTICDVVSKLIKQRIQLVSCWETDAAIWLAKTASYAILLVISDHVLISMAAQLQESSIKSMAA